MSDAELDAARQKLPAMVANVDTALTVLMEVIGRSTDLQQVKKSREFQFAGTALGVFHTWLCSAGGVKALDHFIVEDAEMR